MSAVRSSLPWRRAALLDLGLGQRGRFRLMASGVNVGVMSSGA